jgi:hypothetical protein
MGEDFVSQSVLNKAFKEIYSGYMESIVYGSSWYKMFWQERSPFRLKFEKLLRKLPKKFVKSSAKVLDPLENGFSRHLYTQTIELILDQLLEEEI